MKGTLSWPFVPDGGMVTKMRVTFWGIRGSGPAAGKEYACFGGNTSCVSAEWEDGLVIFDAGTGISRLGEELVRRGFAGELHLFFSHFHLDHIYGLPLFAPIFSPKVKIHIYGNTMGQEGVKERVSRVLSPPYWPVGPDTYGAQIFWHDLQLDPECGRIQIDLKKKQKEESGKDHKSGMEGRDMFMEKPLCQVTALRAAHPDGGLIYRLEAAGRSVVYGLDCELPEAFQDIYADFAKKADLLIFDAAYTDQEYAAVKGFGHATWQQGVAMAKRTEAGKTVFAHHRRERTDLELEALDEMVRRQGRNICFGKEGMEILLQEDSHE